MTKCDKKTSHTLFGLFFLNYYKVWKTERVSRISNELLQSVTGMANCDKKLLQSVAGITKCGNYYKVRRNT